MISFSATNPCHVYDLAVALHQRGALKEYHSGYPGWRLHPPRAFPVRSHSWRTVVTYALLRLPVRLRPASGRLYRWQDYGFDAAVARSLGPATGCFLHGLPGQALQTFHAARARGYRTVLNHASGPVRQQLKLVEEEFRRAGLNQADFHHYDDAYFAREEAEYAAADYHCVASSVVRDQLAAAGVAAEKIWVVPYGADERCFNRGTGQPREPLRVIFAGQLTQRKGVRILLDAMRQVRNSQPAELHLYGRVMPDFAAELDAALRHSWIHMHGPVTKPALADAFRQAAVMVLPSWEEAFGLVVPQALNCGVPCLVSSRVGAGDLIQQRVNGSVFPVGDSASLAVEIEWWLRNPAAFASASFGWTGPAERLIDLTRKAGAP